MHSFSDLYNLVVEINARLNEAAAPPPFKAAERAKAGMPALKGQRTGATPPPIPKPKPKVLAQGPTKAIVHSATPKGDKSLGIKRGFSMHTAAGAQSQPHSTQAIGWAKEKVAQRAAKGESLSAIADECRGLVERRLSYGERKKMPKSEFAIPSEKEGGKGGYPIPDKRHARNALQRVARFGSSSEKAQVKRKVHSKFPGIEIDSE